MAATPSGWAGRSIATGRRSTDCLVARRGDDLVGVADLETFRRENRARGPARRAGPSGASPPRGGDGASSSGRRSWLGRKGAPSSAAWTRRPFAPASWTRPDRSPGVSASRRRCRWCAACSICRCRPSAPRQLRDDPRAAPKGYTLLTWADRWPDEYLDDRCELGRRMSTDVPTGEQELDEEEWDPARVRALEANLAAQDRAKVTTVARHDDSGRLVGLQRSRGPARRARVGLAARHARASASTAATASASPPSWPTSGRWRSATRPCAASAPGTRRRTST